MSYCLTVTKTAYENVFAKMEDSGLKNEFENKDLDSLRKKGINTFYKEWVINPGGSDNEVAVIGSHSIIQKKKKSKAHLMVIMNILPEYV